VPECVGALRGCPDPQWKSFTSSSFFVSVFRKISCTDVIKLPVYYRIPELIPVLDFLLLLGSVFGGFLVKMLSRLNKLFHLFDVGTTPSEFQVCKKN
jgi:hypothetical protein